MSLSPAAEAAKASLALLCCHSISHFSWGLKGGEGINHDIGKFPDLPYCCQYCNNKGNFIILKEEKKSPSLSGAVCSPTVVCEAPGRVLTSY